MALRNFYVEVEIDGRKTDLAGGPQAKDGGMYITLYQRDNGSKLKAVTINCWADENGKLHTIVDNKVDKSASAVNTVR